MLSLKSTTYELIDAIGRPLDQIHGVGRPDPVQCRIKDNIDRSVVESTPYNVIFDLTLNKGQHCGKIRVLDRPLKYQRRYLKNIIGHIINKYNANFTDSQVLASFSVFEIQKTGNLHCHTNLHVSNNTASSITPLACLKDYAKQEGFSPLGICVEYIKDPILRMDYMLKCDTKYPSEFCLSEWLAILDTSNSYDDFSLEFD